MPDVGIRIYEDRPSGDSMFDQIINRIEHGAQRTDDMSETFRQMIPDIKSEIKYEFSTANPASWAAITDGYKKWKMNHGYPVDVGIRTGGLKKSLTDEAIAEVSPKKLIYSYNPSTINSMGVAVGEYAGFFDLERPIMPYIIDKVKYIWKAAAEVAVADGFKDNKK
jgi:hypothetical protein